MAKKPVQTNKPTGGKRLVAARKGLEEGKQYVLDEAISLVKDRSKAKFDETVDIVLALGVDTKNSDQAVRGVVPMPSGLGKKVRVAVFAKGPKADEAEKAGADLVGTDELVEQIKKGEINFDTCIATPDVMGVVGSVAKILGPKGLMPNPKLGTVTVDVATAIKLAKSGQVEFRADKGGIVHAGVGKASFDAKALGANIRAFVEAVNAAKPASSKGVYLKKAYLTSTMGPSVALDVSSLLAA